jgi:hypothetical protein
VRADVGGPSGHGRRRREVSTGGAS